jgi:hypothetical protein
MQEEIDKPPAAPTDFDGITESVADLAQALADMIERYETQEPKESEGMTEAERLLHNLMVKYKERNPKYKVNLKPSPFAVLTDIIKNKDQYAEVWEGAQAIFKESAQGMDESLDWLNRFIDSFISPTHAISADKFMRSVLRAQLKRMNISIANIALEFSKSPDVTMSRFFTELRKSLSELTDAEFEYVKRYMQDYMTQSMTEINEKRKAKLREVKEAKRLRPRKLKNEVDEQLANMIANNIRLHNKEGQPKVRTAEEKLISSLYKKHTDYFGKKKKTPTNIFEMLADIVTDRQAYEHIWFSARSLLQSYPDLAFSDVYTVMQNFNNPIVAESIMRGVVAQIVKENGKTFTETARDYFFDRDTTFKNFFTVLRGKVPDLGDADVKYLHDLFRPYFDKAMNDRRNKIKESLQRQVQTRKKKFEKQGSLQQMLDRLMNIAFRDELSIPELNSLWAERMGLPYLNEEMKKDIYDTMMKVHGMTDSDAISDEIYSLQKRLAENTPSDYVDKVLAWMRFAMLMNPTTLLTNGMSNMAMYPMYNMSDRVQYVVEKVLRIPAEDRISGRDVIKVENTTEIGRVVLQHSTQEKIERHLAKSEKWDLQRVMNVERQYFKNKKIDSLVKSVGRAMKFGEIGKIKISYLGDNKPYTMHFRRSMANTLSAMGYNEGLPEAQKTDMIRKAMDKAANVAAVRTFRQKLAIAKMITGLAKPAYTNKQIREASPEEAARMRYTNQRIRLFARLTFPFVVTPVALTAETYKFSPYAGIVAAFELATRGAISIKTKQPISTEIKKRIARQLSQSAIGTTVMYALGWLLSALGYVDTDEPEAQRDANAWLLEGRQRYSIRIPGIGSVSLGWLQPLATAMFVGANHQKTIQSDGFDLYALLKSSADTIIKATILRDIFNPFNAGSYWEPSDQAEDYVTNAIFMAFPNVIRKFNKAVDPYQREIYGGTGWENFKNKFLSYVPFGSFAIPPEIDMFGNKVKPLRTGGVLGVAERTFLTFATPFTVRRKAPDVVADEILKVYKESKSLDAIPSFPGKEIADKKLNREEYTWYIKESGQIMYDAVQQVMNGGSVLGIKGSEKYNYETAEEQAKILKKIYDKARSMARDKWKTLGSKLPE